MAAHELLGVPHREQGVRRAHGKVAPGRVELDADAVGRVRDDVVLHLQARVAAGGVRGVTQGQGHSETEICAVQRLQWSAHQGWLIDPMQPHIFSFSDDCMDLFPAKISKKGSIKLDYALPNKSRSVR